MLSTDQPNSGRVKSGLNRLESYEFVVFVENDPEPAMHSVFRQVLLQCPGWKLNQLTGGGSGLDGAGRAAIVLEQLTGGQVDFDDEVGHGVMLTA
jgi:hypothetical protein